VSDRSWRPAPLALSSRSRSTCGPRSSFSCTALERRDPRADQVGGIAGPEEPLGAREQIVVMLVPADAVAAAERAHDLLLILDEGGRTLERPRMTPGAGRCRHPGDGRREIPEAEAHRLDLPARGDQRVDEQPGRARGSGLARPRSRSSPPRDVRRPRAARAFLRRPRASAARSAHRCGEPLSGSGGQTFPATPRDGPPTPCGEPLSASGGQTFPATPRDGPPTPCGEPLSASGGQTFPATPRDGPPTPCGEPLSAVRTRARFRTRGAPGYSPTRPPARAAAPPRRSSTDRSRPTARRRRRCATSGQSGSRRSAR